MIVIRGWEGIRLLFWVVLGGMSGCFGIYLFGILYCGIRYFRAFFVVGRFDV